MMGSTRPKTGARKCGFGRLPLAGVGAFLGAAWPAPANASFRGRDGALHS